MTQKKSLTRAEGLEAACILFSINTQKAQVEQLGVNISESGLIIKNQEFFRCEWFGFVHAAIVAGLMVHAPNCVLVDYLRCTSSLLKEHGIAKNLAKPFVDTHFAPYMELLGKGEQQSCPKHFFKSVFNIDMLTQVPPRALALVSATMAMLLSAVTDKLEQYDIASD